MNLAVSDDTADQGQAEDEHQQHTADRHHFEEYRVFQESLRDEWKASFRSVREGLMNCVKPV